MELRALPRTITRGGNVSNLRACVDSLARALDVTNLVEVENTLEAAVYNSRDLALSSTERATWAHIAALLRKQAKQY